MIVIAGIGLVHLPASLLYLQIKKMKIFIVANVYFVFKICYFYDIYKYFHFYSAGIDFSRQFLTTKIGPRAVRVNFIFQAITAEGSELRHDLAVVVNMTRNATTTIAQYIS